jgi:hypothetical protein
MRDRSALAKINIYSISYLQVWFLRAKISMPIN